MHKSLGRNTIVLLGVGHTNAHVLRMWKMRPLEDAQLVCISNFSLATYSGMMPGVLAGQYAVQEMEIDLVRLCQSAGARLILGQVVRVDADHREIHFQDRPSLAYDVLSIGIGSRPTFSGVQIKPESASEPESSPTAPDCLIAIKPMQTFLARLRARMERLVQRKVKSKVAIVGGGIGSIEVACCLDQRLRTDPQSVGLNPGSDFEMNLITGSATIGAGLQESTIQRVVGHLEHRGIKTIAGQRVAKICPAGLELTDGKQVNADVVIWATSAIAPALLSELGFETDSRGFLLTRPTLQLKSHDRIFAVGDSGTIEGKDLPKAGVFAVRQGPVLWDNLRRTLWNRKLIDYVPQNDFLKLINTADGKSIAEYGRRSFYGRWCWWLKDRIDRKFMKMYQQYAPMEMKLEAPSEQQQTDAMRCLGCGGKIGSKLLSQVLSELDVPQHEDVLIGLDHPDDAAVVLTPDGQVTVTTDFFASPVEDPYLVGRIAMLNSASDCFVMGAQPTSALAMIELPLGHPRAQLQVMREVMAGAVDELRTMGATIVGGHSIEGPRLTVGFTVLGRQLTDPRTKGMLQVGDDLILTKAIGSGVLLAAMMQSQLSGLAYQDLVQAMLLSNQVALDLILKMGISAMTDVTGFGLGGHLTEMLRASQCSAKIQWSQVPLYPECQRLIESGIESTLAPENRFVVEPIGFQTNSLTDTDVAALFDPQTCGGLLFGVATSESAKTLQFLEDRGFQQAAVIGTVTDSIDGKTRLEIEP